MAGSTTTATPNAVDATQLQNDAMQKEWLAVQRRYHAQLIASDDDGDDSGSAGAAVDTPAGASTTDRRVRCFVSLSDPDLSERFKGETELLFDLPGAYPTQEPVFDFRHYKSRLTAKQLEAIDCGMKARAKELRGTLSLRKLLTWLDNNFYPLMMSTGEVDTQDEEEAASAVIETVEGAALQAEKTDSAQTGPAETTDVSNATALASSPRVESPDTAAKKKKRAAKKKKDTSKTPCRFFLRQECKSGDKCKFSHDVKSSDNNAAPEMSSAEETSAAAPVAQATKKTSAPQPKAAKQDKISSPAPVEKPSKPKKTKKPRVCKFFSQSKCRDGEKCKFLHEIKMISAGEAKPEEQKKQGIIIKVMKDPAASASENPEGGVSSPTATTNGSAVSSEDWSEAQQKALDKALKKYPATFDKKIRWLSIASEVDGKSLNECIDRFKYLCRVVREEQPAVDAESAQEQSVAQAGDASSSVDKRIIPADARAVIQTEPEEKGSQVRLEELFMHQIGTLVPHRLVCQVQCSNCPLKFDANLALDKPSVQKWCPRCSVLHLVHLRPVFAHAGSSVLAYVDTNENCSVVDVVPSELLATCLECGGEVLFPGVSPMRRSEHACFSCHTKLALLTKRYVVGQYSLTSAKSKNSPSSSPPSSPKSGKKSGQKKLVENFMVGQPLPNKGVCEHYRHSFRWFRFQCCGKAFPCDVCHDSSDCAQANLGKIASRMICGLCSKEQSSAVKQCACGNEVGRKKVLTSHWEGGAGCRDPNKMSQSDKKKFRGMNKTESKKHSRVGVSAKKARDPATAE